MSKFAINWNLISSLISTKPLMLFVSFLTGLPNFNNDFCNQFPMLQMRISKSSLFQSLNILGKKLVSSELEFFFYSLPYHARMFMKSYNFQVLNYHYTVPWLKKRKWRLSESGTIYMIYLKDESEWNSVWQNFSITNHEYVKCDCLPTKVVLRIFMFPRLNQ